MAHQVAAYGTASGATDQRGRAGSRPLAGRSVRRRRGRRPAAGARYDSWFAQPDKVEDDYYRFRNNPRG